MGHMVQVIDGKQRLFWVCGSFVYAQTDLLLDAKVLEIGGGPDPHPAADVIVEKYLTDNTHRMGGHDALLAGKILNIDENGNEVAEPWNPRIVEADVVSMPMFEDKEFDFAIAKDVLEHVPDVLTAAKELSRVAKAGFVDVPTWASEWLWPQEGKHCWVFDFDAAGYLVAHAIRFKSPFGDIMHKIFAERLDMQDAWARSRYYFHVTVFWKDALRVRIGEPAYMIEPQIRVVTAGGVK